MTGPNGRVAIVDGRRTPFGKSGGQLAHLSSLELVIAATRAVAEANDLDGSTVTSLILGSVLVPEEIPYLARQTSLALGWDDADAYSAEYACATGARAIVNGAYQIAAGEHEVVIAGGSESLSRRPVYAPERVRAAVAARRPEGIEELLAATVEELIPPQPQVTEPYSGRTLLQHAEDMVAEWGVSRDEADALAVASHRNAASAWETGRLEDEVIAVGDARRDELVRADVSLEAVAALEPVEPGGTVTAASASRLTDGGSVVLLMSERAAEASGREPRAFLRSWAFTGQDPSLGALIGPAFALTKALQRAELGLDDLDLVDLHEAFAGQVVVNLRAMESEEFAQRHLGRDRALGAIPAAKLNVNGGSIALGHPFGATGGRLVTQSVNELRRRGGRYSGLAICAGGARGAALVFEAA